MADHNRYSVDARAAGRMVLVRSHAERIVVLLGDEVVADHPRQFRRNQMISDPWHSSVLMKKPGVLRNGAPFKDWALPPALTQVRAKCKILARWSLSPRTSMRAPVRRRAALSSGRSRRSRTRSLT